MNVLAPYTPNESPIQSSKFFDQLIPGRSSYWGGDLRLEETLSRVNLTAVGL